MPERVRRHLTLSFALTMGSIALTELVHHFIGVDPTLSAGLFLLGLVPIAYGALGAGVLGGLASTALLSLYTLHYGGPHGALVTWSQWPGALIVLALGLAMTWPMSVIHGRELAYRREIKERAASLERKNAELTEVNAALESFGYVVSHDLKEPVRAIENYLGAAEEEWGTDAARHYVAEAHQANLRLARMLQGLLEYSRTSSLPSTPRPISIEEVLRADICRGRYEPLFGERSVNLDVAPGLPPVLGDEVLLCQVFGNLLVNAARHNTNDKPVVTIRAASAPPGRAHIVVTDNGPGFPADALARFDRLPRRGPATVKTGFGLVIAQRALRRLDGELWLENAPEGGARAHVLLPTPRQE